MYISNTVNKLHNFKQKCLITSTVTNIIVIFRIRNDEAVIFFFSRKSNILLQILSFYPR